MSGCTTRAGFTEHSLGSFVWVGLLDADAGDLGVPFTQTEHNDDEECCYGIATVGVSIAT